MRQDDIEALREALLRIRTYAVIAKADTRRAVWHDALNTIIEIARETLENTETEEEKES